MKIPKGWTESGLISLVERLLAEQQDPCLKRDAVPSAESLQIYLDREKHKLTLGEIAEKRFPAINRPGTGPAWANNPAIARVRRAHRRVEEFLNPQHSQLARRTRKEKKIEQELQEYGIPAGVARSAFGVSPEYLLRQLEGQSASRTDLKNEPQSDQPNRAAVPASPAMDTPSES